MSAPPLPALPRPVRLAVAVLVAAVIFVGSVVDPPSSGQPAVVLGVAQDKWLHGVAYAALAVAVGYAAAPELGRLDHRALLGVFLVVVSYGAGIEVVQAFLPVRAFDLADLAADALGAGVAVGGWRAVSVLASTR